MKLTQYVLDGKVYHLLLNGTALFNLYDRFGQGGRLLDVLDGDTRESHEAAIFMLAELSLQGELYRRYQGEDKGPIITAAQAAVVVTPQDMPQLKAAVCAAIRAGFVRQHTDDEDFDPWLAEIEKKKTKMAMESRARSMCGCLQKYLSSLSGKV